MIHFFFFFLIIRTAKKSSLIIILFFFTKNHSLSQSYVDFYKIDSSLNAQQTQCEFSFSKDIESKQIIKHIIFFLKQTLKPVSFYIPTTISLKHDQSVSTNQIHHPI